MDIISSSNKYFRIKKYYRFIATYKNQNTDSYHVIIKITINWKNIKKITELKKNNIQINLILLLSLDQKCTCTTSNLYFIYPFIELIDNWYNRYVLFSIYNSPNIQKINKNYFDHNKYYENSISINTNLYTDDPIIIVTNEYDCLTSAKKLLKQHSQLILRTQPIKLRVFSFLNKIFNTPIPVYQSTF